jgi:hypothetical protein
VGPYKQWPNWNLQMFILEKLNNFTISSIFQCQWLLKFYHDDVFPTTFIFQMALTNNSQMANVFQWSYFHQVGKRLLIFPLSRLLLTNRPSLGGPDLELVNHYHSVVHASWNHPKYLYHQTVAPLLEDKLFNLALTKSNILGARIDFICEMVFQIQRFHGQFQRCYTIKRGHTLLVPPPPKSASGLY